MYEHARHQPQAAVARCEGPSCTSTPSTALVAGEVRSGDRPDLQSGASRVVNGHLHNMDRGRGQAALQHIAELIVLRDLRLTSAQVRLLLNRRISLRRGLQRMTASGGHPSAS